MTSAIVFLAIGAQQQVSSTLSTGPYTFQWGDPSVSALSNADVVAIVEPTGRIEQQSRPTKEGQNSKDALYVVDTFRVVDSPDPKVGPSLTIVVPQRLRSGEHRATPPFTSKRYLLLAERPKNSVLLFRNANTGLSEMSTDAKSGELAGCVLLPTSTGKVVRDQDVERSFLRSTAEALAGQTGANAQQAVRFLMSLKFEPNDRFGTLSAKDWLILFASGDVHRGLRGAPISTQMMAHELDMRWQVPGSVQSFLNQAPAAEKDLDEQERESWTSILWAVNPAWAGVSNNELVPAFFVAKTFPVREFILRAFIAMPTKRFYEKLLDGLTDSDLNIRFALLETLARLDNKPGMAPSWTTNSRGERQIKDEAKLDTYWNRRG